MAMTCPVRHWPRWKRLRERKGRHRESCGARKPFEAAWIAATALPLPPPAEIGGGQAGHSGGLPDEGKGKEEGL